MSHTNSLFASFDFDRFTEEDEAQLRQARVALRAEMERSEGPAYCSHCDQLERLLGRYRAVMSWFRA